MKFNKLAILGPPALLALKIKTSRCGTSIRLLVKVQAWDSNPLTLEVSPAKPLFSFNILSEGDQYIETQNR
jgi:hypothetical protein